MRFHADRPRHHRLSPALGRALRHRAVPAHVARRDGPARLGQLRRHHRERRRLCRSPELRHGHRRAGARGAGLPGRHHRAARLAQRGRLRRPRPAEPVLRHHRRQHGFDGQPLHRRSPGAQRRRVYPGGCRGQAAGPLGDRIRAARARGVRRGADRHRRHRGFPAPHRALRLLVREGAPLGAAGCQGGPAGVWQWRAADLRARPPPRGR